MINTGKQMVTYKFMDVPNGGLMDAINQSGRN